LYNVYDGTTNKNNVTANAVPSGNATYDMELGKLVNNTAQYFKGDIARIIIATAIPTATQLTQIQQRVQYEYGTFPI